MDQTLNISEVFYSLAGEGGRSGEASVFIRLQGCSAKHACAHQGVICDTEFESGKEVAVKDILMECVAPAITRATNGESLAERSPLWIVFTGGEPLDSLNVEILTYFRELGYLLAIETSGVKYLSQEMADCLDWITVSPKCAEHILVKNFGHLKTIGRDGSTYNIDELRYVRHAGQPGVPEPKLTAFKKFISPHSDGANINQENLKHCIGLCLRNPEWLLSVQMHKLLGVL